MEGLLKYGAIGLILALSILLFSIFKIAIKKESLTRHNFYVILIAMGFVLIVMFIGIMTDQLNRNKIEKRTSYAWRIYNRNGCCIKLPDIFKEKNITKNVQYYQTNLNQEISLKINCIITDFYHEGFKQIYDEELRKNESVTYQFFEKNIFVISGNRDGGKVFYLKGLLKNKSVYFMLLEYPQEYQSLFDEIITEISLSFK